MKNSVVFYVEEESGILDLVVSAITGDDGEEDDKTKTEVLIIAITCIEMS